MKGFTEELWENILMLTGNKDAQMTDSLSSEKINIAELLFALNNKFNIHVDFKKIQNVTSFYELITFLALVKANFNEAPSYCNIYIIYSRLEYKSVAKIVSFLNLYLYPVNIYFSEEFNERAMEQAEIVIYLVPQVNAECQELTKELKLANHLNKRELSIFYKKNGILGRIKCLFGPKEKDHNGFCWDKPEEKDRLILQLIAWLGKDKPIGFTTGIPYVFDVKACDGYFYHINGTEGKIDSGKNLLLYLREGTYTASFTMSGNLACTMTKKLVVKKGLPQLIFIDLDTKLDEVGYNTDVQYPNGHYRGRIQNKKCNGQGTFRMNNGYIYSGIFKDGEIVSGKLEYPNGCKYEGGFTGWERNGNGEYLSKDGTKYNGTFINGRIAHGKIVYPNGDQYEGDIEGWKKDGTGKIEWNSGIVYEGQWIKDLPCGFGVTRWQNGEFLAQIKTSVAT